MLLKLFDGPLLLICDDIWVAEDGDVTEVRGFWKVYDEAGVFWETGFWDDWFGLTWRYDVDELWFPVEFCWREFCVGPYLVLAECWKPW